MRVILGLIALAGLVAMACAPTAAGRSNVLATKAPSVGAALAAASPTPLPPAKAPTVNEISRAAADVPAPITRTAPDRVVVHLTTKEVVGTLDDKTTYSYWTFDGTVPGPLLRVRVGDTVELHLHNDAADSATHSIDLHAVTGPGGGATVMQTLPGKDGAFTFKALRAGIYVYHCATPPVPMHLSNGMYGMILVEPAGGLPKVDHEYYVMQSELYTDAPFGTQGHHSFNNQKMVDEHPDYVLFNGRVGALTDKPLTAKVGEKVRIYFGVGGYLPSNFHVIGEIFETLYPDGSFANPIHDVQTTLVPAGGAVAVEFTALVPGRYILVDHALPRTFNQGAVGYLEVTGPDQPDIYNGTVTPGSGH